MAKVALLIGVSEYDSDLVSLSAAVGDVLALKRILEDPEMGGFDSVKPLINPDLVEMQVEIEALFSERNKDDLVVLFFSGHGIKDGDNNLNFSTRITRKNTKGELMHSTAVPARFVRDRMNNSRAKRQVVVLDCCFSGAFDPSLESKDDGSLDFQGQLGAEGRVVLASSSSTQYSFEKKDSELSIYTKYLVEGIETGAADHDGNGSISILELHDYATQKVQEEVPNITPKIIVLKDKGFEIILAKTKAKLALSSSQNNKNIDLGYCRISFTQNSESLGFYNPVPSLLQLVEPFIERLIEQFRNHYLVYSKNNESALNDYYFALESIRRASDAEFVFSMCSSRGQDTWELKAQSNFHSDSSELDYAELIRSQVLSSVSVESIFTSGYHGLYRTLYDEKQGFSKAFLLIPLESSVEIEFIVVCGLPKDSSYLNDAYTKVVSCFYKAIRSANVNPSRVESAILDDLKRNYGFLPLSLYNRRFDLFCGRLEQINVFFQPILDLDIVAITRWEALARDADTLEAPIDLFDAAELWGRKFTTELDIKLLERAARQYSKARKAAQRSRIDEIDPLSVNVYPESLMRSVYYDTVAQITQAVESESFLIPARNLILEISEKTSLPSHVDGICLEDPLQAFKKRLLKYKRKLKIKFGIDDFGVGQSSISRLAGLNPPYVKIDRDILHQPHADIIIKFVHEVVEEASQLRDSAVIIEGVDENSPINLRELKALGVSYVQGYIVGRAEPEIYRLSPEKKKFLREILYG